MEAGVVKAATRDDHSEVLLKLIGAIHEGTDVDHVFALVAAALQEIFDNDRFALVLRDAHGELRITETSGLSETYLGRVEADIQTGAGARALEQRRPIAILDASSSRDFAPLQDAAKDEGFRSVVVLPLFSGAESLGYLIMYHNDVRAYSSIEVALSQALAQQAAFALRTAGLLESTRRRRGELEQRFRDRVAEAEAIDAIVLNIASSLDPRRTLQSIVDAAAKLSRGRSSALYLRDGPETFRAKAACGIPLERLQHVVLSTSDGLVAQMMRTLDVVQVSNFSQEVSTTPEAKEVADDVGVRGTLAVPLLRGAELIGALYVGASEATSFSDDAVRLLRRLASFAQVALQNATRFSNVEAERSRLQAYVDAIPEGVIVFDREGRVVMTNQTLEREWETTTSLVGLTRDEVFRMPAGNVARPMNFRFDPGAVFERVVSTGNPEQGLLEVEDAGRAYEMHFGSLQDDTGEVQGVVTTIRDVTLPLRLGRERSRSHLLAELLNASASLNSSVSVGTLMDRVVEAAMNVVGATSGTIGLIEGEKLVFERFHAPSGWLDLNVSLVRGEGAPGRAWETMQPYLSNDCANDPQVLSEIQQRFGFRRLVCSPMIDNTGKVVGTLSVYDPAVEREFDRTDVEAVQLLAHQAAIAFENVRLSQLKDEFLSIVSHELKTPITSIKGFTQILQRRLPRESLGRSKRYLEVINHQADRLTALINDLLDLSRIQTGGFAFDLAAIDYASLVHEVAGEVQLLFGHSRIEVLGSEVARVNGNVERLRQVLVNLIQNAIVHGPYGGTVTIVLESAEGDIVTRVVDEGQGVPADETDAIFQPYYQVRPHERQQAKGLGLGLYISRRILDAHGGRIWVDPSQRTAFCFSLPRV